jgi:hypothetical protein
LCFSVILVAQCGELVAFRFATFSLYSAVIRLSSTFAFSNSFWVVNSLFSWVIILASTSCCFKRFLLHQSLLLNLHCLVVQLGWTEYYFKLGFTATKSIEFLILKLACFNLFLLALILGFFALNRYNLTS